MPITKFWFQRMPNAVYLDELEMLDVTREKLFPGLESAAERIKKLFVDKG